MKKYYPSLLAGVGFSPQGSAKGSGLRRKAFEPGIERFVRKRFSVAAWEHVRGCSEVEVACSKPTALDGLGKWNAWSLWIAFTEVFKTVNPHTALRRGEALHGLFDAETGLALAS